MLHNLERHANQMKDDVSPEVVKSTLLPKTLSRPTTEALSPNKPNQTKNSLLTIQFRPYEQTLVSPVEIYSSIGAIVKSIGHKQDFGLHLRPTDDRAYRHKSRLTTGIFLSGGPGGIAPLEFWQPKKVKNLVCRVRYDHPLRSGGG